MILEYKLAKNNNMIKTVNLTKVFHAEMVETTALNGIDLDVARGEFVAIMGPSGCGKSTLLNILGLLDNSDSGEYYFEDTEVSGFSEKQRTNLRKGNIGFIFQSFNLIDELNIYENVELPLLALNEPVRQRKERVEEILDYMKIGHRRNHFPRQLSGGQQQRVAIARALITKPKLILADEPTGNLDSANGEQVMQLMEEMNSAGTTILMVTHSMNHAERAHRIVNLFDGHLVFERSEKLFEPVGTNYTKA
jgi:putative ABC transport system ATP-binding protein